MRTMELASLRVAEEITELVGETPVLHLKKLVPADAADVYAKLEYLNPGGSIKDRAALGIITDAERKGLLRPGSRSLKRPREIPELDWRSSDAAVVTKYSWPYRSDSRGRR